MAQPLPWWLCAIVRLSFLERQVLSSRDLASHPLWDFLYGGLNYQNEHHLFPPYRESISSARRLLSGLFAKSVASRLQLQTR